MEVRPVRPGEWREIRSLRLRALAEAPGAFSFTLAEAESQPDEGWQSWVAGGGRASSQMVVAAIDGAIVGMADGAYDEPSETAHLFAMWVDPAHRGAGIGDALVEAIVSWAADAGHRQLVLTVAVDNVPAIRLYERCGFVATDEAVDPEVCAMPAYLMRLDLD